MNSALIEEMSYLCTHNQIRQTMKKEIYLAGGCFWGTEHYFKQIQGVMSTEVGFANGHTDNPTYQEVYTDQTGYAETVHIEYDEQVVGLEFLLNMFFKAIDPMSLNRQGHDEINWLPSLNINIPRVHRPTFSKETHKNAEKD